MSTINTFRSDLYALHNYVSNALLTHPKEIFIESLRNFFANDSYYHYVKDEWGFPKTPDLTNIPLEGGISDDATTRIFIGEPFRYDVVYYPAVLVKSAGSRFVPISFNNNRDTVEYAVTRFIDGYGNETFTSTPAFLLHDGAWEGSINIDIETKSHRSRDELVELISIHFIDLMRWELQNAGVFVKGINISSPSEADDRTDKLFKQTVTCDIRTEWHRKTPVQSIIDIINLCIDFGNLQVQPSVIAPNIRISSKIDLIDAFTE